jgi:hypothetical protein
MSDKYYNAAMRGRLAAGLVALVILVTGVIPAVAGYRCIAMGVRMEAPSSCCEHEDDVPALKSQCCESVAAALLQPRTTQPSPETTIQPQSVVGWIVFPSITPVAASGALTTPARARGRPPGERQHLLSTVLRV